ncbi:MAG: tRNA 4-thiouridine(8) synthase ThiI [Candidatus Moranbacteria bacterium]|jgi:thiamine biosynthesis protein ThiI|nr:tRNA 4-thiouridine(8) synthase ThiI [Candidatus Moranbacteria bacterium]
MKRHIIIHYNEIALKGGNRRYFETILIQNIQTFLQRDFPEMQFETKNLFGRILVSTSKSIDAEAENKITEILKLVFGIANFSFAWNFSRDLEEIQKNIWQIVKKEKLEKKLKTFRISARRSDKSFPLTSNQINQQIGSYLFLKLEKKFPKIKVSLKNPNLNCFIEITEKTSFVYFEKIKGAGGIPVSASGKALALLSGGIDSPVAAYFGMKRGVKIDFIHFHSLPFVSPASIEKVKQLAKITSRFQPSSKIFLVPFGNIQKEILINIPEKLRILFYRRLMMQISESIAKKEKYLALYTGESVAQVASQTLENIHATNEAVEILVLRPLIGFDKEDIIAKAQEIRTFETSIIPHQDCCTRFVPKHPETRAKIEEIKKAEKNLDIPKIIQSALKNMEIEKINQ